MKESELSGIEVALLFGVVVTAVAVSTGLLLRKIAKKRQTVPIFSTSTVQEAYKDLS